ncbi:hypothetical protein BC828DRAFT_373890 [Blastocladiella britannica]|nr:hypothetical protein BC828DRAFT_373890 [Blastocladiella britannica]
MPPKRRVRKAKKPAAPNHSSALLATEYRDDHESAAPFLIAPPRTKPAIGSVVPNSSLLSRLESLLPQLQSANAELFDAIARDGQDAHDLERVTPGSDRVIQMKLGLGVFEERALSSGQGESSLHGSDSGPTSLRLPSSSAFHVNGPSSGIVDMDVDQPVVAVHDGRECADQSPTRADDFQQPPPTTLEDLVMGFYDEGLDEEDDGEDDGEDEDGFGGDKDDMDLTPSPSPPPPELPYGAGGRVMVEDLAASSATTIAR